MPQRTVFVAVVRVGPLARTVAALVGQTAIGAEIPAAAVPAVDHADGSRTAIAVDVENHGVSFIPIRTEQQLGDSITVKIAQQPAGCLVVVVPCQKIRTELRFDAVCTGEAEIADIGQHHIVLGVSGYAGPESKHCACGKRACGNGRFCQCNDQTPGPVCGYICHESAANIRSAGDMQDIHLRVIVSYCIVDRSKLIDAKVCCIAAIGVFPDRQTGAHVIGVAADEGICRTAPIFHTEAFGHYAKLFRLQFNL